MPVLAPLQILLWLTLVLFLLGLLTFLLGLVVLYRAANQPLPDAAARHAVHALRKGVLDGVSESLVQANSLLITLHGLTQTSRGIGLVLLFTGLALIAASGALFIWLLETGV